MKFVKLSVLALSMGLFAASCGNSSSESTKTNDTTAVMATTAPATPPPAASPATADTMAKPADTTAKMGSKMDDKKMEKK